MSTTKELIQKRFDEAQAEIAEIETAAAPLRAELDAACATYEQARLIYKAEKERILPQLLAIQQPKLIELSREVSALASALGGLKMSDRAIDKAS